MLSIAQDFDKRWIDGWMDGKWMDGKWMVNGW